MKYNIVLLFIFTTFVAFGQERHSPKLIKSNGDYVHAFTGMTFPKQVESYPRKSIYSFTKLDDDIEVTYEISDKTSMAIKVYPAGDGTE